MFRIRPVGAGLRVALDELSQWNVVATYRLASVNEEVRCPDSLVKRGVHHGLLVKRHPQNHEP